jgi:hypothetical protein
VPTNLVGVCLKALEDNSATNPGVKKMYQSIMSLMSRLGVEVEEAHPADGLLSMTTSWSDVDLDAIIRSVPRES